MNTNRKNHFYWPKSPHLYLVSAVLADLFALAIYLGWSVNLYRDSANCYAYAVREAAEYGRWEFVLDPGLPVLSMLLSVPAAMAGLEAHRALYLVGGLFLVLTIFPLYGLLKRFVSPLSASFGCLLYALTPKLIRYSCMGLLEPARNFFFLTATLLFFQLADRKSIGRIILFSLSLTGLSLARAEGCVIAGIFLAALPCYDLWIHRRNVTRRKIVGILGCVIASGMLTLLFLAPKISYNFVKTGYPTLDTRFNPYLNTLFHAEKWTHHPPDFPGVQTLEQSSQTHRAVGGFDWAQNFHSLVSDFSRGAYEPYFVLALLGLVFIIGRPYRFCRLLNTPVPPAMERGWRSEYTIMAVLILAHCVLYFSDCSAFRYYTFMIPFMILWALLPLTMLWHFISGLPYRYHAPEILGIMIVAISTLQFWNGIEEAFRGRREYEIGLFLKRHAADFLPHGVSRRVRVIQHISEVCYFSGFEYVNTSLNIKSRTLQQQEKEFDLLVCTSDSGKFVPLIRQYRLTERKNHPYTDQIRIFVRSENLKITDKVLP